MISVKTKRASKDSLQRGRRWQGRQRERACTVSEHRGVGEKPGNLCDPLGKLMGKGWREGKEVRQERTGKEG